MLGPHPTFDEVAVPTFDILKLTLLEKPLKWASHKIPRNTIKDEICPRAPTNVYKNFARTQNFSAAGELCELLAEFQ